MLLVGLPKKTREFSILCPLCEFTLFQAALVPDITPVPEPEPTPHVG